MAMPCASGPGADLAHWGGFRGPSTPYTDLCSPPHSIMAETFAQAVSIQADDNGQISLSFAGAIANLHGLYAEFKELYRDFSPEDGVDVGEFLVWLGY